MEPFGTGFKALARGGVGAKRTGPRSHWEGGGATAGVVTGAQRVPLPPFLLASESLLSPSP